MDQLTEELLANGPKQKATKIYVWGTEEMIVKALADNPSSFLFKPDTNWPKAIGWVYLGEAYLIREMIQNQAIGTNRQNYLIEQFNKMVDKKEERFFDANNITIER